MMKAGIKEKLSWLALAKVPNIGPLRFKLLINYYGSAEKVWSMDENELRETGLPKNAIADLVRTKLSQFEKITTELAEKEISVVCAFEDGYPPLLKELADYPPVLFYRGSRLDFLTKSIAVVGTRRPTAYGRFVTEKMTSELVHQGFTIISGLALGVDAIAHRTALEMNGRTLAVLGSGVDMISPKSNDQLAKQILLNGGSIVSEYWPGVEASSGSFPARNRIISGLSVGVVITEGAADSGSLITARAALDQNREVFAVPGPITSPLSVGPMSLIKQGAKLVTTVEDIVEELEMPFAKTEPNVITFENELEAAVYAQVTAGKGTVDEIVAGLKEPVSTVIATLTSLEMRGVLQADTNRKYAVR